MGPDELTALQAHTTASLAATAGDAQDMIDAEIVRNLIISNKAPANSLISQLRATTPINFTFNNPVFYLTPGQISNLKLCKQE